MKRTDYKTFFSRAFMTLAFMGAVAACVEDEFVYDTFYKANSDRLSVMTAISEATVVTRATTESDSALMEKKLNTLDVFVEPVDSLGKIMSQYHLTATADKPIKEQFDNWLADNWRAEGLEYGKYYNIYVATNNTQTKDTFNLDTLTVTKLKALVASEVKDSIAFVDSSNNIDWPWTDQFKNTPSGFIYKQYIPVADTASVMVGGSLYGFTTEKEFMMDGILENWTPSDTTRDQVFKPVVLNRAAAKIVLNLKFDPIFLKSLTQNMTVNGSDTTWTDKPDNEQFSITGAPAWRFYNFAFGAPVFAPETQGEGVEVHNSATLLRHPYDFAGANKQAQIITYTYPNKWEKANYATKAPSLVISVAFLQNGLETPEYHYYRIPLVKNTVTEIKRNHIYVVNATIATRGSELHEDVDEVKDVIYEVLPWNDENNSDAIHNTVESVQHYYFRVSPKVYTLRGDGDQSVTLNYSKATGTKVNWKLFTYDNDGNQTGVVEKDATGATRAWFYDADGDFTTTYGDSNENPWTNMGVTITQSQEGTSKSSGTVKVTSKALTNKAIKYIRLRVYLDEVVEGESLEETYHEDILIRHFPTDNIQSIEGKWSSYYDANEATTTTTYKTRNLEEAQSLAQQYNVTFTSEEIETTELIDYATWNTNRNVAGYHREEPEPLNRQQFRNGLTSNTDRRYAYSEDRGILADGYYYWGVNPYVVNNNNQADYYISGWGTTYYAYQNRYRTRYTHTYTYSEYTLELPIPSTGEWVNWEDRGSHNSLRTYQYSYIGSDYNQFRAKVAINGNIRYIVEEGSGYWGDNPPYTTVYSNANSGLTNNHMYVIQISSTSDKYILGRPYVNESTHQSQDDVVSPAFMIASQLGAVTPFSGEDTDVENAADASTHCSRYMEVTEDGIYYTGWRLPTAAEIKVITEYQYGNIDDVTIPNDYLVLTPVLTGYYYWDLAGNAQRAWQPTGNQTDNSYTGLRDKAYLRCVRDLSAEEVDRLNGFDKIQEKYR